jgi:hypothetical protein
MDTQKKCGAKAAPRKTRCGRRRSAWVFDPYRENYKGNPHTTQI